MARLLTSTSGLSRVSMIRPLVAESTAITRAPHKLRASTTTSRTCGTSSTTSTHTPSSRGLPSQKLIPSPPGIPGTSDLYQADVAVGQPVGNPRPVIRLPSLPRRDGLDGHHDVRGLVADHRFDEAREIGLGGPEIVQEVSGNHGGFPDGHRVLSFSSLELPGAMQRRTGESKRNADTISCVPPG